jgi:hypothetical protein
MRPDLVPGGAVCRPRCRYTPLFAAICSWLECTLLIFVGFFVPFQAEGRGFGPGLALH